MKNNSIKEKKNEENQIAIIGIGGKYPQSENHHAFWKKIASEENFIQNVPEERWDHSEYFSMNAVDAINVYKTGCKFGAFISDYNSFDANFFNIKDEDVKFMDPQERLALETTWSCIEDAGYIPQKLGKRVGIFSGITYSDYQKYLPICTHAYLVNCRIAFQFDFIGPSITIDSGCCSSLSAVHCACQSIINQECPIALVIGANLIIHPDHYIGSSSFLSTTLQPYSKPFGRDDGWIPAEGVISMLLKPLNQALNDNDNIYGIIKSSMISQNGKGAWFSAYNPNEQANLIQENIKKSGIHPETIGYVEAAANGSSLGDAIEIEGLKTIFKKYSERKGVLPIGSVKSNVGHGEAVSTLLQMTKILMQFKYQKKLPIINLNEINQNIKIEDSPFYFQKSNENWLPIKAIIDGKNYNLPRRAIISAFGAGGNMGNIILEERGKKGIQKIHLPSYFIPLSSQSPIQLKNVVRKFIDFIDYNKSNDPDWNNDYSMLNIMYTLCNGRNAFPVKVVFIAEDINQLLQQMNAYVSEKDDSKVIKCENSKTITGIRNGFTISQNNNEYCLKNNDWNNLAKNWLNGMPINWDTFFNSYEVRRVSLPTYCFKKDIFPLPKIINKNNKEISKKSEIQKTDNFVDFKRTHINEISIQKDITNSFHEIKSEEIYSNKLSKIIIEILSNTTGVPMHMIEIDEPLENLGFDSEMVVKINGKLNKFFNNITKTLFFECRTVKDIVKYIVKNHNDEVKNLLHSTTELTKNKEKEASVNTVFEDIIIDNIAINMEKIASDILNKEIDADTILKQIKL